MESNPVCAAAPLKMEGDALSPEAIYKKETLANPDKVISRQAAGTVHVHPNGRFPT